MASGEPGFGKRLQYGLVGLGLRVADAVAGGANPSLRGVTRYLGGLIAEGRHAEVDVLLSQGAARMARRLAPFLAKRRAVSRRSVMIDAATQRLRDDGQNHLAISLCDLAKACVHRLARPTPAVDDKKLDFEEHAAEGQTCLANPGG